MIFIYYIKDYRKSFMYGGKRYNTPCQVTIKSPVESRRLRNALSKNRIKNVKVLPLNRPVRWSKRVPLGLGDGCVTISAKLSG
jgi:hypothetical protein